MTLTTVLTNKVSILFAIIICIIFALMFFFKKVKMPKKSIGILLVLMFICIAVIIILLSNIYYYIIPTFITQEQREGAIAKIDYSDVYGIDAANYTTYYIYKSKDEKYYYIETSSYATTSALYKERIFSKKSIKGKEQLESIINNFEERMTDEELSSFNNFFPPLDGKFLKLYYKNNLVEKNEFLNAVFK